MRVDIGAGRIYLKVPYEHRELAKSIQGATWQSRTREWGFPISRKQQVCDTFPLAANKIKQCIAAAKYKMAEVRTIPDVPEGLDVGTHYFKRQPFPHQKDMMSALVANRQFAFFCEMGTGKTKATIDAFEFLYNRGVLKRALIVCPKTIITVWEEEIKKDGSLRPIIIQGTRSKKIKLLTSDHEYAIINYESLLSLSDYNWSLYDFIVLDESARIKNPKAKITKMILDTFEKQTYKLILSGTPVTQGLIDIFCQFKFLNPEFLQIKNYYAFRNTYCMMGGYQNYQIVGYNEELLPTLKAMISRHSIQLKKEDCMDLPEKIYQKRIIDMSPVMKAQYTEMYDTLMLELSEEERITAPIVLTKLLRLQEICAGSYIQDQKYNKKLTELKTLIEDNPTESVVIWARFRKSIDIIRFAMQQMGIDYSIIHGDIKNRAEQIQRFQEKKTRVFIGQIQAGGEGITLTAGSLVIVYENTFSLKERKQFEDRVHRPGQDKACTYVDLVYRGTVDVQILQALRDKQNISSYLVDSFMKGDYRLKRKKIGS